MARAPKIKTGAIWVIDTHGLRDALTSPSNSIRAAVIDAVQAGKMLLLKPVSRELKETYEDLYKQVQQFSSKKYLPITAANTAVAASLMESYGSSILGSIPATEHFEAIAAAHGAGCILISSGKALGHYKAIAKKCTLPKNCIGSINDVI